MDVAERRRQKLLARGLTLDKQGASNPNQAKLEADALSKSKSAPTAAANQPPNKGLSIEIDDKPETKEAKPETKEVPIIQPRSPKKKSVNLKYLQVLMEQRDTFQISKKVYRLTFSIKAGIVFHFLHYAKDYQFLNLGSFACALLVFYWMLETAEKLMYTNKINVSSHRNRPKSNLQAMLR